MKINEKKNKNKKQWIFLLWLSAGAFSYLPNELFHRASDDLNAGSEKDCTPGENAPKTKATSFSQPNLRIDIE